MYAGVPMMEPAMECGSVEVESSREVSITVRASRGVRLSSAPPSCGSTFASPQSTTCTSPNAPTMMFSGFRSRWMTRFECAYAIVWQTCSKMERKRRSSLLGDSRALSIDASVRPLMSFIVKNGRSSAMSPSSYTGTTPGCWSCPPICASSTKRCTISGRLASSSSSTLIATSRRRSLSCPRRIAPIPPRATSPSTW